MTGFALASRRIRLRPYMRCCVAVLPHRRADERYCGEWSLEFIFFALMIQVKTVFFKAKSPGLSGGGLTTGR